jgi:hypothetical protein
MAQVKLFVSYAHADFVARPPFNDSRVGQLLSDIKHDIGCYGSRPRFCILRDVEQLIQISQSIHGRIDAAIAECDAALVLLSENYCLSEECAKEFDQLVKCEKPIFVVETEDVSSTEFAEPLANHKAYMEEIRSARFWGMEDRRTIRFGYPMPHSDISKHRDKYVTALEELVAHIKDQAKDILSAGELDRARLDLNYTMYLASPTSDVKAEADQLEKAVEADGSSVLRIDPGLVSGDATRLQAAFRDAIARCDIYVQLLGSTPGRSLGEGPASQLAAAQYAVATELGKRIYSWRKSGFDIGECRPDYSAFLSSVQSHLTSIEEFEQYVRRKAKDVQAHRESAERRKARGADSEVSGASLKLVAIDVAQADNHLARRITAALRSHVDIDTLAFDLDASALSEAVADNDAIILGYGPSEDGQRRAKAHFKIIRKKKGEQKAKRFELAVGDAAPETAPPCPQGPDVHVISVRDEIDEAALLAFLTRLKEPAERPTGLG